jgi:phosphatidate cytidylyltransferase
MRERFVLGPILITVIVVGLALDQYIDGLPMPSLLGGTFKVENPTMPPGVVLLPIMLLVAILGARELASLLAAKGIVGSRRIMSLSAFIGLALSSLVPSTLRSTDAVAAVSTGAVAVLAAALAFHARHKSVQGVLAAAGASLLAFVYLGLMFGFLLAIRREHEAWVLLWVLLVTKSCDIGAYLVGKSIGRHKLIPWLSPGKTWEGLFGGIAMATGVSIAGVLALDNANVMPWPGTLAAIAAGVLFAVVGQAGDLLESLLKRDAGHKDSGRSVPGFGGVLDLLDSPLLVAPVAYWWLRAVL